MTQPAPNADGINIDDLINAADTTTSAYRLAVNLADDDAAPPGVSERLAEAVDHLLHAGYTLAWGTGLRSRALGAMYTQVFWLRRRRPWSHHRDKGFHAVAELALVHTSKVKKQADTAVWKKVEATGDLSTATTGITRAWLCLGQVAYALESDTDLTARSTVDRDADETAYTRLWISGIADRLAPLAITMSRYSGARALAPAAGLATLAHQCLTDTLNAVTPLRSPRPRLDLTSDDLDLPNPNSPRDVNKQVAEMCAQLDGLAEEAQLVADRLGEPEQKTDIAADLARTATHLTAASKQFQHWATNL